MSMNIYAKEDSKVKPIFKDGELCNGYDAENEEASKHLEEEKEYTVLCTQVGNWSTKVTLKEIPGVHFNSVHFEDSKLNYMKIIIAGSRDFFNYQLLKLKCDKILKKVDSSIEIVSGEARGADKLGEEYAVNKKYRIKRFPADWEKYGKSAGFRRNEQMAEYADCLIAFWDSKSRGTKHMIDTAKSMGLSVRIIRY